ncbi:hypothetical protein BH11PLA2_BH11PLA2_19960 [soil metagenome]
MSRTRVIVLLVAIVAIGGWMVLRPHPSASAASSGEITADYGENTEEIARLRWESNQSRHWRQAVTRK